MKSPDHCMKWGWICILLRVHMQGGLAGWSSGWIPDCEWRQYAELIVIYNKTPINPETHFPNCLLHLFFCDENRSLIWSSLMYFLSGFFCGFKVCVKAATLSQTVHFFLNVSSTRTPDAGREWQGFWETVDCISVWLAVAHFLCTVQQLLLKISCMSITSLT